MTGTELAPNHQGFLDAYRPIVRAGFGLGKAGDGRTLDLGTVLPMTSAAALAQLADRRRAQILGLVASAPTKEEAARLKAFAPLTFQAYRRVLKQRDYDDDIERHFWVELHDPDRHEPTLQGYASYLCDLDAYMADIITTPLTLPLPVSDLKRHSYVVGGSGAGKSELLKILIHDHIAAGDAAVVVLDAHSDLCEQIARWPEVAADERLVFVAPSLFGDMVPTINPFTPPHGADDRTKEKISNRLAEVIGDICRGEGSGATVRMVALAKAAIRVLLDRNDSTLQDLYEMLGEDPPAGWIAAGRNHPDKMVGLFFRQDWNGSDYKAAKGAMRARLANLLLHKDLRDMTCGPSTVPLYDLVEQGKVLLFSLGQAGKDSARVVGKLIVSMVAALGDIRKETDRADRRPVHIVIDECQNFVGPATQTILTELRKYGLHLTLANQSVKMLPMDDRDTVITNTAVKILGRSDYAPAMLSAMGCDNDEGREMARNLTGGVFLVRWGTAATFMLTARSDYADDARQITKSQWIAVLASQRPYYRRLEAPAPPQIAPSSTTPRRLSRELD